METTLIGMLEKQAERASFFPDYQNKIRNHHEETKGHANIVEGCIERLGGDVSDIRATLSKFVGEAQSQFLGVFKDSVVKDGMVGTTSEQFEIVTYKSIIALANKIGDDETVSACQGILKEEEEMFEFFSENLEELVNQAYDRGLLIKS